MANSIELDKVRAALATLETGETDLRKIESMIGEGLSDGSFTRTEVNTVLRDAIQTGRVSSDAISQLLESDGAKNPQAIDATRLRRPTGSTNNLDSSRIDTRSASLLPNGTAADGQLLSDRYLLERKLGQGGMGIVYFARDLQVGGETFAIKLLNSEIRQLPEALEMVREEVRKTRSLAHPNIVGVYSVNVDRDDVFILMEYLEGKALNSVLDDDFGRGMPFNRAWPWIQDICTGLAYAHDHSVIHSDLKPSNIFVTTSGKAKLLDFGIARAARGGTGRFDPATLAALTPAYASCEMLEGDKPDQRDDVYALGCVIYEMLSGKHPFDGASALEARRDGLKLPPIASLTKRQNAALAQALAFDRAKRTDTVEVLLTGLGPNSGSSRLSVGRPRPLVWIGGVGSVLLLLIGFMWFLNGTQDKNSQLLSRGAKPSQPSNDALLNRVQMLVANAGALELDPADPKFQQGKQQLDEAQLRSAAGKIAEGQLLLGEAENNLSSAIRSAKRLVHIGSNSDEIALAMRLCQQIGSHCTAADFADETPRTVALAPFELDKTEATNQQFGEFVAANKYMTAAEHAQPRGLYSSIGSKAVFQSGQTWKTLRDSMGAGVDASVYPVRGMDFKSANDYCGWRAARLPTEDEWEFVARGANHRIFAWGNEPRLAEPGTTRRFLQVNDQPMTGRFGARGLGDGILEWVNGVVTPGRVLRGASWLDKDPLNQRLASRRVFDDPRIYAFLDTGLRCAKSVESWPD